MRKKVNINYRWSFSQESMEVPREMPSEWTVITLPHTWNGIDGQDGGNDYYRGTCYYAKKLLLEDLEEADEYYLEINGANSSATVYYNNRKIAEHDGGYSTWRVRLPEVNAENLLLIAVDNSKNERVYPQKADFTFYGGLYRDVNVICVNKTHFDLSYYGSPGIAVTPTVNGKDADISVKTWPVALEEGDEIEIEILAMDGKIVERKKGNDEISFSVKSVHFWHGRKDPYLYSAKARIIRNGKVLDEVSTRFGVRTFRIDSSEGFFLNGESYPLHGVSRHQDRWLLGNAITKKEHDEDMELICEVGANTIRLAHYQHDQYFYDLCDEKGMIVWAEIPYISSRLADGNENTISQMKELVCQNYNHPSIVVWGLSNEITINGASPEIMESHKALNDLVHKMDKTRLSAIAVVYACSMDDPYIQIPDVVSYNHYFGWYGGDVSEYGPWLDEFHRKYPDIPIGLSEYGCEALNWHSSNPVQGDYTEEYQAYYHEEVIKQLFSRKYIWASHVWNMFDFGADARSEGGENGQNHKGLVTFDRKYKKDSFYAYKAWLSEDPFVHICSKRFVDRTEDTVKITVYSNLPEVELYANGVLVDKVKADDHFFRFSVKNDRETILTAVAGECRDTSLIRKVDEPNPDYRLKEKGAVLNWFDITAPDGCFSLNDKIGDILSNREAARALGKFGELLAGKTNNADKMLEKSSDAISKMIMGFTVLRMLSMAGLMYDGSIRITKEELLEINKKLNKVRK